MTSSRLIHLPRAAVGGLGGSVWEDSGAVAVGLPSAGACCVPGYHGRLSPLCVFAYASAGAAQVAVAVVVVAVCEALYRCSAGRDARVMELLRAKIDGLSLSCGLRDCCLLILTGSEVSCRVHAVNRNEHEETRMVMLVGLEMIANSFGCEKVE